MLAQTDSWQPAQLRPISSPQGSPTKHSIASPILTCALLPRGSSSESEHSVWGNRVALRTAAGGSAALTPRDTQQLQTGRDRWSPDSEDGGLDAQAELDQVHDALEGIAVGERLATLPAGEHCAAALKSLEAITRLTRAQAFLLQARAAVDAWLAGADAGLPHDDACRLRHLVAGMQVETSGSSVVRVPDGGAAGQSRATFVLSHAFECPGFQRATGTVCPAFVTADLRCYAEFSFAGGGRNGTALPVTDRLSMGIDIEWQAQPLGAAGASAPPTVGARSMPRFLVAATAEPKQQVPDVERLARLQGLLGVQTVPARTFLSFLKTIMLAPQYEPVAAPQPDGADADNSSKRRRLSSEGASSCTPPEVWSRASRLLEGVL